MEALAQQLPQGDLMEIAATDSSTVSRLLKPSLGPPVRIVSKSHEACSLGLPPLLACCLMLQQPLEDILFK
jgi:hypothetical protein